MLAPPFVNLSPEKIPDLQDVQQLAFPNGAPDGIAAIRKDGSVWVRGEWANSPDWLATGIDNAAEIWGEDGLCARKRNGEIWCWRLSSAYVRQTIRVRELDGAIDIDFSGEALCGIMPDGRMRCCELKAQSKSNCQFVRGLSHIKSGSMGVRGPGISYGFGDDGIDWYGSGCALTKDGEVLCFGRSECDSEAYDELFRAPQVVMPGKPVSGDEADLMEQNRQFELRRKIP